MSSHSGIGGRERERVVVVRRPRSARSLIPKDCGVARLAVANGDGWSLRY